MRVADRPEVAATPRSAGRALASVIIPCYNAGPFLDECVESIRRQGIPDLEIIIVDDGSTEPDTGKVLAQLSRRHHGIEVVRTENQGPGPARNVGLLRASGEFVLCLDADDLLSDGFLLATVAALQSRPDCDVAYTDVESFGLRSGIWTTGPLRVQGELYLDNWLASSFVLRRSALHRVGGYDPAMPPYGEDWDFCLRLHEAGARFTKVSGVRSLYRIRANSLMQSSWRRPIMINRLVLNHRAAYSRLFGWPIGAREEARILRLLRVAADQPNDERTLEALAGSRVCRQFVAWSLAYRAIRRFAQTVAGATGWGAGR